MSLRTALTLAAPGALALAPAAAWLALAPESAALAQGASGYPYAAFGVVALLGWRFQRSRIVAAAVALALANAVLRSAGDVNVETQLAVGLIAPVLALVAITADRRLGAPRGMIQLGIAPIIAGGAILMIRANPQQVEAWLGKPLISSLDPAWAGLPQMVLGATLLGLAALAAIALRRQRALEAGLFWCALAGTIAVAAPADSPARGTWMLAAALALGVALVEAAYALAFRDDLTDLPGRRALRSLLGSLRPPYCIAVVDVDRFKGFNDRYGHDVGDQVLRMVAAKLAAVGGGGRAFRSGGEEFTIVFPGRSADEAMPHLEAVRRTVADTPFVLRRAIRPKQSKGAARRGTGSGSRRRLRVTISIGLARSGGRATTPDQVAQAADRAMYRAKQSGRNRVVA